MDRPVSNSDTKQQKARKKKHEKKNEKKHDEKKPEKNPDAHVVASESKEKERITTDAQSKKVAKPTGALETASISAVRNPARVLCIDGGGVRGVVPLEFLACLEGHAKLEVTKLFDVICGTSTGGIIAFLIGALGMKVQDCIKLYQSEASAIFDPVVMGSFRRWFSSKKYDSKNFVDFIKAQLGALNVDPEITLGNLPPSHAAGRVHVFAVATRRSAAGTASLFRNYPAPGLPDDNHLKKPLWGALRATSAAPTFFEPMVFKDGEAFVDGGILYNCPLEVMSAELRRMGITAECIVSLGCGSPPPHEVKDNVKSVVEWMIELATAADGIANKFVAPPNCLFHRFQLEGISASLDNVKSINFVTQNVRDRLTLERVQKDIIKTAKRLTQPAYLSPDAIVPTATAPQVRDWSTIREQLDLLHTTKGLVVSRIEVDLTLPKEWRPTSQEERRQLALGANVTKMITRFHFQRGSTVCKRMMDIAGSQGEIVDYGYYLNGSLALCTIHRVVEARSNSTFLPNQWIYEIDISKLPLGTDAVLESADDWTGFIGEHSDWFSMPVLYHADVLQISVAFSHNKLPVEVRCFSLQILNGADLKRIRDPMLELRGNPIQSLVWTVPKPTPMLSYKLEWDYV